MLSGKENAALRLLSDTDSTRILPASKQYIDLLKERHLLGAPRYDGLLLYNLKGLYEEINGSLIYKIAHGIKGATGQSNMHGNGWHHVLTSSSFGDDSRDLCSAIALIAKKLRLKRYCGNGGSLEVFFAHKLIPLDKKLCLKPIVIGEVIGELTTFRRNILESAGDLQLNAGQCTGFEALYTLYTWWSVKMIAIRFGW